MRPKGAYKTGIFNSLQLPAQLVLDFFSVPEKQFQMTGPSVIFAYILIGIAMFFFLRTIGEMLYNDPSQHSFLNFVTKYSGIRTGYFTQWSYWLVIVFVCISELTAIGTYIQFGFLRFHFG